MRYVVLIVMVLIYSGCSTKEVVKNPEMLALSNVTMSYIKGNEFVMGSYDDRFKDKAPREVRVENFYIDKTEVTNGAYRQYIDETGGKVLRPPYIDDLGWGLDLFPVVGVTHAQAKSFCEFYGKRLPTEAEWEFAARGGKNFKKYSWGDEESADFMNFRGSNNEWAVEVASYPPNAYGLFDMSGNVREWVEDTYEKDFYIRACTLSPWRYGSFLGMFKNPFSNVYKSNCYLNPINTTESIYKSNRGGSWDYSEGYPATVSFRFFDEAKSAYKDLGFRCAANAKKSSWIGRKYDESMESWFGSEPALPGQEYQEKAQKLDSSLVDENRKRAQEYKNLGELGE